MVVVVAMSIRVIDQTACHIICYYAVRTAGNAAKQLDACLCQSHLRTGADAAAENDVDAMLEQEADQCAVALPVGENDLTAEDAAVFDFIEFELCRMAEVLEYLAVFIRNCDFHFCILLFIVYRNSCRSGWLRRVPSAGIRVFRRKKHYSCPPASLQCTDSSGIFL